MKMVFQQKVQEKEAKLKQSEEELYARHKEMKDALERQRADLEEKKRRIESGRPLTPEKGSVSYPALQSRTLLTRVHRARSARASCAHKPSSAVQPRLASLLFVWISYVVDPPPYSATLVFRTFFCTSCSPCLSLASGYLPHHTPLNYLS